MEKVPSILAGGLAGAAVSAAVIFMTPSITEPEVEASTTATTTATTTMTTTTTATATVTSIPSQSTTPPQPTAAPLPTAHTQAELESLKLAIAARECGVGQDARVNAFDNGVQLMITNIDYNADSTESMACMMRELDTPQDIINSISATTPQDRVLSDSWNEIRADWWYIMDHGLTVTFTQVF